MVPRAVIVTRPTVLRLLLQAHGTLGQARFFLEGRGQRVEPLQETDARQRRAVQIASQAVPTDWRQARVDRADLDRFLFEPEDIVLAVGQDGLVANVARFLDGQPVIGLNPDPEAYDGVLVPHRPADTAALLARARHGDGLRARTLVEARLDDGTAIRALNEVFLGQPTHQSARYTLHFGDRTERHSSSGLIVSSGTGCTGWARSICRERAHHPDPPTPWERDALFLVREAFPSHTTGTALTAGRLGDQPLVVRSEMDAGVIFADGIESDRLPFGWGRSVEVRCADRSLQLLEAA